MPSKPFSLPRRRTFSWLAGGLALASGCRPAGDDPPPATPTAMFSLFTFGDSILDCGRYNPHGIDPGQLLVRNDDRLFPEFRGQDLQSRRTARLVHRAVDGATVERLEHQAQGVQVAGDPVALVTIGGNDLLRGLATDAGGGVRRFAGQLEDFCRRLPVRPIVLGTVYDPTFGDDARNFLGVDPRVARANHRRVNAIIRDVGQRYGAVADLHAHFLTGTPEWYTNTIEPSLVGASEVRRVFWAVLQARGLTSPLRAPS